MCDGMRNKVIPFRQRTAGSPAGNAGTVRNHDSHGYPAIAASYRETKPWTLQDIWQSENPTSGTTEDLRTSHLRLVSPIVGNGNRLGTDNCGFWVSSEPDWFDIGLKGAYEASYWGQKSYLYVTNLRSEGRDRIGQPGHVGACTPVRGTPPCGGHSRSSLGPLAPPVGLLLPAAWTLN
jgi:hypothetical protein